MRYRAVLTRLVLIGLALAGCARRGPLATPSTPRDGFVHDVVPSGVRPRATPLPAFLPGEEVRRPQLRIDCTKKRWFWGRPADTEDREQPDWRGIDGDIDETGHFLAWIQALDEQRDRRYVFRIDDIDTGATVHAVALPRLPGSFPAGKCKGWLTSSEATSPRDAMKKVSDVLSKYVFRSLYWDDRSDDPARDWAQPLALELLRKRSDAVGDWTDPGRYPNAPDEDHPNGPFVIMAITPSIPTLAPHVVAVRCGGVLWRSAECAGAERGVVFSRSGELLLAYDFEESTDGGGSYSWIRGVSPRRQVVVFGHATGFFAEQGMESGGGDTNLAAARTYRALRCRF